MLHFQVWKLIQNIGVIPLHGKFFSEPWFDPFPWCGGTVNTQHLPFKPFSGRGLESDGKMMKGDGCVPIVGLWQVVDSLNEALSRRGVFAWNTMEIRNFDISDFKVDGLSVRGWVVAISVHDEWSLLLFVGLQWSIKMSFEKSFECVEVWWANLMSFWWANLMGFWWANFVELIVNYWIKMRRPGS